MASSRNSIPADPVAVVLAAVEAAMTAIVACTGPRCARIAVALSGGNDSMALLDALSSVARRDRRFSLMAVHVHHGISPNSDAWTEFCSRQCADRGIPLFVSRVVVDGSRDGLEAAARKARHAVFASTDVDAIALAHHRDDQAETVLLQLLRGAGPHGLAAMPGARGGQPQLLRPLLTLERTTLEAYNRARGVPSIDDESNADEAYARNFVRTRIAPLLAGPFPGYSATLERAARHQAEAAHLLDELAAIDAGADRAASDLAQSSLATLSPPRARNLLRWFLRKHGLRAPSESRLDAMLTQLITGAADASILLRHDGLEIGRHRGRVKVHAPIVDGFEHRWRGERELALPGGILAFVPHTGDGLAAHAVADRDIVVRSRAGGESIRLRADGPTQDVKKLFQAAAVPAWERKSIPFLWVDSRLVAVPGIGIAHDCRAAPHEAGWRLDWRRHPFRLT